MIFFLQATFVAGIDPFNQLMLSPIPFERHYGFKAGGGGIPPWYMDLKKALIWSSADNTSQVDTSKCCSKKFLLSMHYVKREEMYKLDFLS